MTCHNILSILSKIIYIHQYLNGLEGEVFLQALTHTKQLQ